MAHSKQSFLSESCPAFAVSKERIFKFHDYWVFALLTCIGGLAIIYFMAYWFSFGDWAIHPFSFSILTFIVLIKIANSLVRWFALPFMKKPRPMASASGLTVGAVTSFVPGAESLRMLEETVRAMVAMDYPHDTWVLDEGDDQRVKNLCHRLGAFHFSRKDMPEYQTEEGVFQARSKHGNYNAWLFEIGFKRYEIIAAFDPDHVPVKSFLSTVLGYFSDPTVGYVQAAQVYYNQQASFIARGAAEETYDYYSCTQMAAGAFGQPAMVGCHNTHRTSALEAIGGFAPHDADDLLTGLHYQSNGWQGVYLPQILAKGLTPVDWNGYLTQQLRWARSVIDVKFGFRRPAIKNLPTQGWWLSALHGLFYVQNSVTTFIGILLLTYMLAIGSVPQVISMAIVPKIALLFAVLQAGAFYRQKFYLDPTKEWGIHWRAYLLRYAKWPIFLLAIWNVASGRRLPYALTRKVKTKSNARLLIIPHSAVIFLISAACVTSHIYGHTIPSLLYWLAGITALMSLALILTTRLQFPPPFD